MLKNVLRFLKFRKDPIAYARELGVTVGDGTKLATYDFGSEPFLISIGRDCHITKKVRFITHDGGVWIFRKKIKDFDVFGRIAVGDNVYIGNDSVIMPGVTIGSDVVVGAASVVTKSIPSGCVVAGIPAKFICTTEDYLARLEPRNFKTKGMSGAQRRQHILEQIDEKGLVKGPLTINGN